MHELPPDFRQWLDELQPDERRRLFNALLRRDFLTFLKKVFHHVNPEESFDDNWHIHALAWHLNEVAEGRIRRLLITIPPRSLKSIAASVALPAWCLGRHPTRQIITVSYAQDLANKFSNDTRAVMTSPWYLSAFPGTRLDPKKNTEAEFMTTKRGFRLSTSVGGTLTGRGGDIIIIDDPIKPSDANSDTMRAKVIEWYVNTLLSRLNNRNKGAIVLVMQRVHEADLAAHVLEEGGWVHLDLPAIAEEDEKIRIGPLKYHHRKVGEVLHPERISREELLRLNREIGTYNYTAQYQQRPVPKEGLLFKLPWFGRYRTAPELPRFGRYVLSWDTASKTGHYNDFSVCTVWAYVDDTHYLVDVFRAKLEYPDLCRKVLELNSRYHPPTILIEDAGVGTSLIQDLDRRGLHIFGIRPERDKFTRAMAQTATMEAGKVFIPEWAPWLDNFLAEVSAFPGGRHDDQVDSMVQYLAWFKEHSDRRVSTRKFTF